MASPLTESEAVRVRVAGKINLALLSGPKRADGYHSLATVFQAVSLYDDLEVRWAPAGEFRVTVQGDQAALVPCDDTNLAVRAARLLAERMGPGNAAGAEILIKKAIPVTGGMAGGSADAAASLLACSVLWDVDASPDDLRELGVELGADVPFSLTGGTALGTDRGDRLAPVLSRGTYHWVLAFSEGELSTPAVFRRFDELGAPGTEPLEVSSELLNALVAGDAVALGKSLVNDLHAAAISLRPHLAQILEAGREHGALGGIICGSGPTVAFLAAGESAAVDLSVRLSSEGICRGVRRVTGPVPGARLVG